MDTRTQLGDQLIQVNGLQVSQATYEEVIELIRKAKSADILLLVRFAGQVPYQEKSGDPIRWLKIAADPLVNTEKHLESMENSMEEDLNEDANSTTSSSRSLRSSSFESSPSSSASSWLICTNHEARPELLSCDKKPQSSSSSTSGCSVTTSVQSSKQIASSLEDYVAREATRCYAGEDNKSEDQHSRSLSPSSSTSLTALSSSETNTTTTEESGDEQQLDDELCLLTIVVPGGGQTSESFGCGVVKGPDEWPGIFVQNVKPASLAERVGLEPGDQLVRADSHKLERFSFDQAIGLIKRLQQQQDELVLQVRKGAALHHLANCKSRLGVAMTGLANDNNYDEQLQREEKQPPTLPRSSVRTDKPSLASSEDSYKSNCSAERAGIEMVSKWQPEAIVRRSNNEANETEFKVEKRQASPAVVIEAAERHHKPAAGSSARLPPPPPPLPPPPPPARNDSLPVSRLESIVSSKLTSSHHRENEQPRKAVKDESSERKALLKQFECVAPKRESKIPAKQSSELLSPTNLGTTRASISPATSGASVVVTTTRAAAATTTTAIRAAPGNNEKKPSTCFASKRIASKAESRAEESHATSEADANLELSTKTLASSKKYDQRNFESNEDKMLEIRRFETSKNEIEFEELSFKRQDESDQDDNDEEEEEIRIVPQKCKLHHHGSMHSLLVKSDSLNKFVGEKLSHKSSKCCLMMQSQKKQQTSSNFQAKASLQCHSILQQHQLDLSSRSRATSTHNININNNNNNSKSIKLQQSKNTQQIYGRSINDNLRKQQTLQRYVSMDNLTAQSSTAAALIMDRFAVMGGNQLAANGGLTTHYSRPSVAPNHSLSTAADRARLIQQQTFLDYRRSNSVLGQPIGRSAAANCCAMSDTMTQQQKQRRPARMFAAPSPSQCIKTLNFDSSIQQQDYTKYNNTHCCKLTCDYSGTNQRGFADKKRVPQRCSNLQDNSLVPAFWRACSMDKLNLMTASFSRPSSSSCKASVHRIGASANIHQPVASCSFSTAATSISRLIRASKQRRLALAKAAAAAQQRDHSSHHALADTASCCNLLLSGSPNRLRSAVSSVCLQSSLEQPEVIECTRKQIDSQTTQMFNYVTVTGMISSQQHQQQQQMLASGRYRTTRQASQEKQRRKLLSANTLSNVATKTAIPSSKLLVSENSCCSANTCCMSVPMYQQSASRQVASQYCGSKVSFKYKSPAEEFAQSDCSPNSNNNSADESSGYQSASQECRAHPNLYTSRKTRKAPLPPRRLSTFAPACASSDSPSPQNSARATSSSFSSEHAPLSSTSGSSSPCSPPQVCRSSTKPILPCSSANLRSTSEIENKQLKSVPPRPPPMPTNSASSNLLLATAETNYSKPKDQVRPAARQSSFRPQDECKSSSSGAKNRLCFVDELKMLAERSATISSSSGTDIADGSTAASSAVSEPSSTASASSIGETDSATLIKVINASRNLQQKQQQQHQMRKESRCNFCGGCNDEQLQQKVATCDKQKKCCDFAAKQKASSGSNGSESRLKSVKLRQEDNKRRQHGCAFLMPLSHKQQQQQQQATGQLHANSLEVSHQFAQASLIGESSYCELFCLARTHRACKDNKELVSERLKENWQAHSCLILSDHLMTYRWRASEENCPKLKIV